MAPHWKELEFPPFGDLPPELQDRGSAKVHVLPVPFERTSSYLSGSARGPSAILRASCNMELYDEELRTSPSRIGIHTLPAFRPPGPSQEEAIAQMEAHFREILRASPFVGMLSSEHSVTVPMVRATAAKHPGLSVLQFDAHSDLRDSYDGTPYSHACAMRRVAETCPVVAVGIRSLSEEEAEALPTLPVTTFWAKDIVQRNGWITEVVDAIPRDRPLYITVDMDGFDPGIVPAVGTPEPGGLGWYDAIGLLHEVCRRRKVVGFDILELCPREQDEPSAFLAAKLFYKMVGYTFCR